MWLMNDEQVAPALLWCTQCKNRLKYSINAEEVAEGAALCHLQAGNSLDFVT